MSSRAKNEQEEEPVALDGLALQALEHWKEFRPKMYRQLEKSGELYRAAQRASEQTQEALHRLLSSGLQHHEAWALVREEWVFLPSEEDVPELGKRAEEPPLEFIQDEQE